MRTEPPGLAAASTQWRAVMTQWGSMAVPVQTPSSGSESSTRTETTGLASSTSPAKVVLSIAHAGWATRAPATARLAASFFTIVLLHYRGDAANYSFKRPALKYREPYVSDHDGAAHGHPNVEPLGGEHVDAVQSQRHPAQRGEPSEP